VKPRDITIPEFDFRFVERRSRSLPHWETSGGVYFITFRLQDNVPSEVLDAYRKELKTLDARIEKASQTERRELYKDRVRLYCRRIDKCLDVGLGDCLLGDARMASVMVGALRHFDRVRYDLFTWAVMPNHVHVILRPHEDWSLSKVLHTWKSYSATQINIVAERRGPLWEREYFDHLVRSGDDLVRFARYVMDNPRKAGLNEWAFAWRCEELGGRANPAGSRGDTGGDAGSEAGSTK